MIAVVDYGVGNLFSLACSLKAVGAEAVFTADPAVLAEAEKLILPGVGAFRDAAAKLAEKGLAEAVIREAEKGKPLLGICLGMQLLFDRSYEDGNYAGLGLIPGEVKDLRPLLGPAYKVPHMGWNPLRIRFPEPLLAHTREGESVYFVHSYFACCDARYVAADAEYGVSVPAVVRRDNVCGCQFHPEKSGPAGRKILWL